MLSVKVQSNIPHCPPLFAAKSLVSSSIGNEYTFFQTLDDHITQPVLFIPETHLSSLQRMVGPHLTTVLPPPIHILAGNRAGTSKAGEKKKTVGKYAVGKVGGWGDSGARESEVKHRPEIRWANWSRNQTQVQAATAADTEIKLWALSQKHMHARTWWDSTHTFYAARHPHILCFFYSDTLALVVWWECCSDRTFFPRQEA